MKQLIAMIVVLTLIGCGYPTDSGLGDWTPRPVTVSSVPNKSIIEHYAPPVLICNGWVTNVDSIWCTVEVKLTCNAGVFYGVLYTGTHGPKAIALPPDSKGYYAVVAWGHGVTEHDIEITGREYVPNGEYR